MKKLTILIGSFLVCSSAAVFAQEKESAEQIDTKRNTRENLNNPTFRDDSTDAAMGFSPLSGTPGRATTSGAGGLGTNVTPGYNTSSDIYNMERRDSIRQREINMQEVKDKQPMTK